MIYKLIAPLLSPYYRLIRGVASLASKLFFFYALLVAIMAFARNWSSATASCGSGRGARN